MRVGHIVYQLGRHERLHATDERHCEGVRGDDREGLPGQRYMREEQLGQALGEITLIADRRHADRTHDDRCSDDHDRYQRGGYGLGDSRHEQHDHEPCRDERVDGPRHADQLRELGGENQDREGVDEADHDTARNESHQFRHAENGEDDLQHAGQQHGRDEVVHPVLTDHRCHHERNRAGGRGDHRGAAADERHGHGHDERRVQAGPGIDPGDEREADRLRNKGQRDDESGEHLAGEDARRLQRGQDRGFGSVSVAIAVVAGRGRSRHETGQGWVG